MIAGATLVRYEISGIAPVLAGPEKNDYTGYRRPITLLTIITAAAIPPNMSVKIGFSLSMSRSHSSDVGLIRSGRIMNDPTNTIAITSRIKAGAYPAQTVENINAVTS